MRERGLKYDSRALIQAVLVNGLILAVLLILFRPFYDTNDDPLLRDLINGSHIISDPHLVYQNIVLGLLYKALYALPVSLPWYEIVQYMTIFISLTAFTCVCYSKAGVTQGQVLCLPALLFGGYECYIAMQYTKTAGVACACGLALLFEAIVREKVSRKAAAAGIFITCLGCLYRMQQAAACGVLCGGGLVVAALVMLPGEKERRNALIRRYLIWGAILLACIGILTAADALSYRLSDTWKDFRAYDRARQELLDYGMPDFEENKAVYEANGIDQTACKLLVSWQFADQDVFTREAFENIAALKGKPDYINKDNLAAYLKAFPYSFFHTHAFYVFVGALLFWLFAAGWKRRGWLVFLYEVVVMGALYYYLFMRGRYMIHRVDVGLWFAVAVVLLWWTADVLDLRTGGLGAFAAMCAGIALLLLCPDAFSWSIRGSETDVQRVTERQEKQEKLEKLVDSCEDMLIISAGGISGDSAYGPFEQPRKGLMSDIVWIGGWDTFSASFYETLHAHQVENLFRDVEGREDVVLAAVKNVKRVMQYIRAHYDPQARSRKIKKLDEIVICRVIKKEAS